VAKVGAVLSPVLAGILRDPTGYWPLSIYVNAALLGISLMLVALVKRKDW